MDNSTELKNHISVLNMQDNNQHVHYNNKWIDKFKEYKIP